MLRPRLKRSAILVLLLASCLAARAEEAAPRPRPSLALVSPERLRQGDPLLAWVVAIEARTDLPEPGSGPSRPTARLLDSGGSLVAEARCFALPAILEKDEAEAFGAGARGAFFARSYGALIALPTDLAPGPYTLVAASEGKGEADASLVVEARDFPLEDVGLDEANTAIRNRPNKRKDEEARKLRDLLAKTDDSAVFADGAPFLFPVKGGFKSAGFGDRRRYLLFTGGSESIAHAGLDWGVVAGTPVRACERGKVAMVADREVTGKTVVVEHLPGLYSLYFHLSSIAVRAGAMVERGTVIARSGSTGMSTGPHLHWELRAKGAAVDPEHWLGVALLDKEAIKATIIGLIEGR
jgi:murein DD-endopeptidase MepM/ murein hydrolase activator NlpD